MKRHQHRKSRQGFRIRQPLARGRLPGNNKGIRASLVMATVLRGAHHYGEVLMRVGFKG